MADIRTILGDKTNTLPIHDREEENKTKPKAQAPLKRKRKGKFDPSQRPLKFVRLQKNEVDEENIEVDESVPSLQKVIDISVAPELEELTQSTSSRRHILSCPRVLRQAASSSRTLTRRLPDLNHTLPYLQSFVSSQQHDLYKILPSDGSSTFALPTGCSFSHAAKNGGRQTLAISTEQGSIEIMSITGSQQVALQQTSIQLSNHIVFDVKWREGDDLLAAVSADRSVYIIDSHKGKQVFQLEGHLGSVKALAWDPCHRDLLTSASRAGDIVHWDLRIKPDKLDEVGVLNANVDNIAMDYESAYILGKKDTKGAVRSITSLLYLPLQPFHVVSSGSTNGILRKWDIRMASPSLQSRTRNSTAMVEESLNDPTLIDSKRARGISSLALGSEFIYGLGCDSRIHAYPFYLPSPFQRTTSPSISQLHTYPSRSTAGMITSTFYSRLSASPCFQFGAVGSKDGSIYLFDLASRRADNKEITVKLTGHGKEIGGIDWAKDCIVSCSDDRTIRIWRYNEEVYQSCSADPDGQSWHWLWTQ